MVFVLIPFAARICARAAAAFVLLLFCGDRRATLPLGAGMRSEAVDRFYAGVKCFYELRRLSRVALMHAKPLRDLVAETALVCHYASLSAWQASFSTVT